VHLARRTEQTYCVQVNRFIFFHGKRHRAEMAEPEINSFLPYLPAEEKVNASKEKDKAALAENHKINS
jgi:hypothetical protein